MERIVRTFEGEGRRAVILRFGLFYGPESASTHDSVKMMRRRMFPVMGAGGNYFSSIHVDDAARAVVAALEAPGGTYNVVEDEPVTQREYADACAKAFDTPRPWSFPAWTAQLMMGGPAKYVMQSMRVSNKKFKAVTGWSPDYPGVGDGFRQVAEEMAKAVK
jgi:nucleoside-diphosphate-sugar epimerase